MPIISIESTPCYFLDVIIFEVERIILAFSFVNQSVRCKCWRAKGSENVGCSIEVILVIRCRQISVWARPPIAWILGIQPFGIIEASYPLRTDIGCERPFANPYWIFEQICLPRDSGLVFVAGVLSCFEIWRPQKSLIIMDIDRDFVHIIVSEEVVPLSWVVNGSSMHDEPGVGRVSLNQLARCLIKVF